MSMLTEELVDETVRRADSNEDRLWHLCKNKYCPVGSLVTTHTPECAPYCGADVPPRTGAKERWELPTMDVCVICDEMSEAAAHGRE